LFLSVAWRERGGDGLRGERWTDGERGEKERK